MGSVWCHLARQALMRLWWALGHALRWNLYEREGKLFFSFDRLWIKPSALSKAMSYLTSKKGFENMLDTINKLTDNVINKNWLLWANTGIQTAKLYENSIMMIKSSVTSVIWGSKNDCSFSFISKQWLSPEFSIITDIFYRINFYYHSYIYISLYLSIYISMYSSYIKSSESQQIMQE